MVNKNKGFGSLEIILIVLVISIIGIIGFKVLSNSKYPIASTSNMQSSEAATSTTDETKLSASQEVKEKTQQQESQRPEQIEDTSANIEPSMITTPQVGTAGTTVQYKITGLNYKLEDNLQIFFVDSAGHHRSMAAFSINDIREDALSIPQNVFNCSIGSKCTDEVPTAIGKGAFVLTHSNDFIVDLETEFTIN